MLDFGWAELIVLVAVAVFVIGPKDIPNVMYGLGRIVRRIQYMRFAVTQQFDEIMNAGDIEELRKGVNFEVKRHDSDITAEAEMDDDIADEAEFDKAKEPTELEALYNAIAVQYAQTFNQPSEYLDDFLTYVPKQGRVLDAGCGVGVDVQYLTQAGYSILGVDAFDSMLNIARQKNPDAEFQQQNILELDFAIDSFDAVIAAYSLIHLSKAQMPLAVEKFAQVLKPSGVLYISVHGGKSDEIIVPEPFNPNLNVFLNIMSFSELENILQKSGFEILHQYVRSTEGNEEFGYDKIFIMAQKVDGYD